MLAVTVSGSFHRHMGAISAAVQELASLSIRVLSPADPRVVATQGEFLFVASDPVRSVRLVQDRHLDSVRASDFLWLVCPDGYVGQSASMEIGFAAAVGVPIFATRAPLDLTLRQYVAIVPTIHEAIGVVGGGKRPRQREGLLIDPHASIEHAHRVLDQIGSSVARVSDPDESASRLHRQMSELTAALHLPTYLQ